MSGLVIAVAPALPLHSAGKYVAGAYIVFLAVILIPFWGFWGPRLLAILDALLPSSESPANPDGIGPTEDDISLLWLSGLDTNHDSRGNARKSVARNQ